VFEILLKSLNVTKNDIEIFVLLYNVKQEIMIMKSQLHINNIFKLIIQYFI
jgi:hypothetical protein